MNLLLAMSRITTFVFMTPFLKGRTVPNMAKLVISVALSVYAARNMEDVDVSGIIPFAAMIMMQIMIGLLLAYITELVFSGAQMAGGIIDLDMGFSQSSLLDPSGGARITVVSNLFSILFMIVFLALGGFQALMYTVMYSFDFLNMDVVGDKDLWFSLIVEVFGYSLSMAIQIAIPLMASMFIVNFMILIIGRMAPQMNILMNMFAIKIAVGLCFLFLSVPLLGELFAGMTDELRAFHYDAIELLLKK
ncbi:flagellar biosynthetic protein FliR [Pontibacillus sp. ALD_SL1]|uniref:flagellar biosynthetic protein FliR n=1 Tax=Pontibacillus sp. ALD_SL1 TaxID=2777185 RepID=UPI0021125A3E|nr:flagellar biosynthetic protein FliR [Pontibacillus sp. ALD_SL1]